MIIIRFCLIFVKLRVISVSFGVFWIVSLEIKPTLILILQIQTQNSTYNDNLNRTITFIFESSSRTKMQDLLPLRSTWDHIVFRGVLYVFSSVLIFSPWLFRFDFDLWLWLFLLVYIDMNCTWRIFCGVKFLYSLT